MSAFMISFLSLQRAEGVSSGAECKAAVAQLSLVPVALQLSLPRKCSSGFLVVPFVINLAIFFNL